MLTRFFDILKVAIKRIKIAVGLAGTAAPAARLHAKMHAVKALHNAVDALLLVLLILKLHSKQCSTFCTDSDALSLGGGVARNGGLRSIYFL